MKNLLTAETPRVAVVLPARKDVGTTAPAEIRAAVVDLPVAAAMLGIGRTLAYRLVRENAWPTPIIRVGRLIKVPIEPLRDYVGARPPASR
jgi:hypothetical protein